MCAIIEPNIETAYLSFMIERSIKEIYLLTGIHVHLFPHETREVVAG